MIRPKTQTEDLLWPIAKNCETLIEQTHRKAEEMLEFEKIKQRETFQIMMIKLTSSEVYNSIFNITEENIKFELYKFCDEKTGGFSYVKVRDETKRDLDSSDTTATDLQDDMIAPFIIEEYRDHVTKRMKDVGYVNILQGYTSSIFQDSESYPRAEVDLVEDDVRLVLDEYNSSLITYELGPVIYTFKDLSESVFNILQLEYSSSRNVIVIEVDDITSQKNWL